MNDFNIAKSASGESEKALLTIDEHDSFLCRRMSLYRSHIGSIQPHQFLSKREAVKHVVRTMVPLYLSMVGCAVGTFALAWMLLSFFEQLDPMLILLSIIILIITALSCACLIGLVYVAPNYYPSRIDANSLGIALIWFNDATRLIDSQAFIPWRWITRATYRDSAVTVLPEIFPRIGGRVYEGPAVDLFIDESVQTLDLLQCASLWPNWPWATTPSSAKKRPRVLRIDLSAFTLETDRDKFLKRISAQLATEQVDFSSYIAPEADLSYTSLWLDSLGSTAQRKESGELHTGQKLDHERYEILNKIASGGQATVYCALTKGLGDQSSGLESRVVLKEFVLPIDAGIDVARRALLHVQQEAALLKGLEHPKIVKLIESFVEDHRAYLVLEYVQGKTLRELVTDGVPLPQSQVIRLATQMCEILSYLHNQTPSIIHRDFTPDNLMLTPDDQLKLIDFNVAQRLESSATRTVVGKHCYLPPEQFRGKATPQSDLYAMGATLFFLLTSQEPEPLSCSNPSKISPSVDPKLGDIIAKLTALELDKRCSNVASAQSDLEALALAVK